MTPDPNVEPSVSEASGRDTPSVSPERSSVGKMRGGLDPRELAQLSAQARRAKKQQRRLDEQAGVGAHRSDSEGVPPYAPSGTDRGAPAVGPHERPQGIGGSAVPWTIEAARRAAVDPKTPAYVAQRAREWLHEQEQKLAARQEPEPPVARRGADLIDVLATAIACGVVDADELVREATARALALESSQHESPPTP